MQNTIIAHRWVLNDNTFDHQDPLAQFDHQLPGKFTTFHTMNQKIRDA
jgi:hypothetical protein